MSEDKSKLSSFILDGDLDVGIVAWYAPKRELVQNKNDIVENESDGSDDANPTENGKKEEHISVESYVQTASLKNVQEQNVERALKDKDKEKARKTPDDRAKEQEQA